MSEPGNADSPLFNKIGAYPRSPERRAAHEDAIVVTDIGAVLTKLQMDPQLVSSIADHTKPLLALLELTYGRQLTENEKKTLERENRGSYFKKMPVGKDEDGNEVEGTLYVKGNSNVNSATQPSGDYDFPGFPKRERDIRPLDLIFDKPSDNADPRIRGTLTMPSAVHEFLKAALILANVAEDQGWKSLAQVVEAGVTVPVGVASLPRLSARMLELLDKRIRNTSDKREKEFLMRGENFNGLGTVGLLVPSTERVGRFVGGVSDINDSVADNITDPEITANMGRMLRTLAEIGGGYLEDSSHGGNVYTKGLMAQADNTDIVFFGDFKTAQERQALIYRQFVRESNLVPLSYPKAKLGIGFEEIAEAQKSFWKQFLGDTGKGSIAHPDAIAQLPQLMPLLRNQFNLAVAVATEEKLYSSRWDKVVKQRDSLVADYSEFINQSYIDKGIAAALSSDTFSSFQELMSAEDPIGAQAMLIFLRTGDKSVLTNNPKLKPLMELNDAIFAIPDGETRDKVLEMMVLLQRSNDKRLFGKGKEKDLAVVTDQIRSGKYDRAERTIKALGIPVIKSVVHRWLQRPKSGSGDINQEEPSSQEELIKV